MSKSSDPDDFKSRTLAKQFGCTITQVDEDVVRKLGAKVRASEGAAIRLVKEHAPSVPVPLVHYFGYSAATKFPVGDLFMSFIPGVTLDTLWDSFDDSNKERVCRTLWGYIAAIRTVPKPANLKDLYCCAADGTSSFDPLLGNNSDPTPQIHNDAELRERIFTRYKRCNGLSYADGKDLPQLLPRSEKSVFTHGDMAPRNIMVNSQGDILGVIDWEHAGWYPDYWEYANMMKYARDIDWKSWMDRTKPSTWDIVGIKKARRVLF